MFSLRLLGWLTFWGFVAWWVTQQPHQAAQLVHQAVALAGHAAQGLSAFAKDVTS